MLDRVFDWFVQSDSKLDRALGGMGVGLSLARKIVLAHGGSIVAHSEGQGRGSEFTIRLPLTEIPLPRPPEASQTPLFDGNAIAAGRRQRRCANHAGKTLQHKGFDVSAAGDGLRGLEVCRASAPRWR